MRITKAFAYGLYDGVADVVKEPTKRYKANGIVGGVAGAAIGTTNPFLKPIAGIVAAVSLPLEGTVKDARALFHKKPGMEIHATRYREEFATLQSASQAQRDMVLSALRERKARAEGANMIGKGKGRAIA
ncbi:hypothetical protein FS749_004308 [Ceratobasidium sp. UAMH 11750]|nr:hypothetical protein FS749_004308 [Ceratobasidium sp. UAMH 11750]